LQETAKRRLAKRRPAQQPVPPVPPAATAATVTWLAPLEKKSLGAQELLAIIEADYYL